MTAATDTTAAEPSRKRVGVVSAAARGRVDENDVAASSDREVERTLAALERAFPVGFEAVNEGRLDGLDGVLVLDAATPAPIPADIPQLVLPAMAKPSGSTPAARRSSGARGARDVLLSGERGVPEPLRGARIPDGDAAAAPWPAPQGVQILARTGGQAVWWHADAAGAPAWTAAAYPLPGLGDGEALREHLRPGRFMGLLPVVDFVRRLLGGDGWTAPPLRAAFIVDDPNLHRPSYGYLDYAEVASHAAAHRYHLALATVPIDGWLTDQRAAALMTEQASVLSLLLHGNDHVARELGRLQTDAEATAAIAQALRRVSALERRAGVTVDRVMAPPHGACSEAALRAMFRLGIEAACISRPYPWLDGLPAATPLAGWHPAELVAGGLPVLPRYHLSGPREELALRALLGQPLILYGHHGDFAGGLDVLAEAAGQINSLGDVTWCPLGAIARSNFATRRDDDTLLVRLHARHVVVDVPPGVRVLRVLAAEPVGGSAGHRVLHPGGSAVLDYVDGVGISEPVAVAGTDRVVLTLAADRPLQAASIPSPGVRLWPWIRRALVEGRDRIQALR